MKTKSKIWLGIGAFALVQAAGVSFEAGRPVVTVVQPAAAADGTCGWEIKNGRWTYDGNCERGERYNASRNYYNNERGERWEGGERGDRWEYGEKGERWDDRGKGGRGEYGERGERGGKGERGEHGERGEKGNGWYGRGT